MITEEQLLNDYTHRTMFKILREFNLDDIIKDYIKSINLKTDYDIDVKLQILLDQYCTYQHWCERTIGTIYMDLAIFSLKKDISLKKAIDIFEVDHKDWENYMDTFGKNSVKNWDEYKDMDFFCIDEFEKFIVYAFLMIYQLDYFVFNDEVNKELLTEIYYKSLFENIIYSNRFDSDLAPTELIKIENDFYKNCINEFNNFI